MLLVKRMRHRAAVFAALLVVVAVASGLIVGILEFLSTAESSGVRSQLAQRAGADAALQLTLASDPDGAAQDARVHRLIARVFRDGDRALPVDITRSQVSSNPVQLSTGVKAFVASIPGLESNASLVDGAWPRAPGDASVQADAAAALGLTPGEELTVGDAKLRITATWRLTDPLDPRWVSDSLLMQGLRGVVLGPIVVPQRELDAIGAATDTRWAIVPRVATVGAGDLDIIIGGWRTMADSLSADRGFNLDSLDLGGEFVSSAAEVQSSVSALGAVSPAAVSVIAAIAVIALVELGRLLATLRSTEHLLLFSRGETVGALTRGACGETAGVAILGSVAGTVVAVVLVGQPPGLLGATVWIVPATATAVAVAVVGTTTFLAARSISRMQGLEANGRMARMTGLAAPIFLGIAAALAVWQLRRYGSPIIASRGGGTQVDPIAVLAPALALIAVVVLVLSATPLLRAPLDRASARSTRPALVSRSLSRRSRLFLAPFVMYALAAGQLTLAAGYAETWGSAYATTAALRAGSDLVMIASQSPLSESVLSTVRGLPGVTAVAAIDSEQIEAGGNPASMIAATPVAIATLASSAGGEFDARAAARAIAVPFTGPVLPHGVADVAVSLTSDSTAPIELGLVVADDLGVQREIRATGDHRFELPLGHGSWKVLAFVVHRSLDGPSELAITSLTADGLDIPLGGGWSATGFTPLAAALPGPPAGAGFSGAARESTVRVTPPFGDLSGRVVPPILISSALAHAARIAVGDTVKLSVDALLPAFDSVVAGIVSAIPGAESDSAVLIDDSLVEAARARLYQETPTPAAAWLGSSNPAKASAVVREAVPGGITVGALVASEDRRVLGSAVTALWFGAVGAGILALIALVTVAGAQLSTRAREVFVLRALGISDRQLVSTRRIELGIVAAAGLAVGVGAGIVVAALTLGPLARAAIPASYAALPTEVGIQPLGLAIGLAALALSLGLVIVDYARRVSR
ncbi:FtsX-like permease family protein [Glaciihabitans sp. INWT7]|uniref:FtsX-like permease family protein n=1 Tax=Glaciihabitans sp. INWT7 TaxID=2596912 RepID=UPI001629ABDB|nr:FtsX-like permease family protein [Glaciihabitans sp. INWT7]QNE45493.1 FtsX-like permease family protein [Glaciihabitans sp. INWT7]